MYQPDLELQQRIRDAEWPLQDYGPQHEWAEVDFGVDKDGGTWFSINVDTDAFLYHMLPYDVHVEMTEALAYFLEHEWNGQVQGHSTWRVNPRYDHGEYSLAQFPAWYRFFVQKCQAEKELDYKERPEDDDEIMGEAVHRRLNFAHENPASGRGKAVQGYLREAIRRVSEEEEPVFAVNGTTAHFWFGALHGSRQEILHGMRLLLDYTSGGTGFNYNCPNDFHPVWREYVSLYNKQRLWIIGVILNVCQKRIDLMRETNIRLNEEHRQKVAQYLVDKRPSYRDLEESHIEYVGGYSGDNEAEFNCQRKFVHFNMDGDWYLICPDYPYSYEDVGQREVFPIVECNEDALLSMQIPHAHASLYCDSCQQRYYWEHGGWYENLSPHDKWVNVVELEWEAWDKYDEMWEEVCEQRALWEKQRYINPGPTQRMFPDREEFYDTGLLHEYPKPLVVDWVDDDPGYDYLENVVYCPVCHQAMEFGAHVNTDW